MRLGRFATNVVACAAALVVSLGFIISPAAASSVSYQAPAPVDAKEPDAPSWKLTREYAGVVYFLFASTPRIERYDMNVEEWLEPITLRSVPTTMAVDGDGIYVSFGPRLVKYGHDGGDKGDLVQIDSSILDLQVLGEYLYLGCNGPGVPRSLVSVFKASGIIIDSRSYSYGFLGQSIAPVLRKIFARSGGISPADLLAITLNPGGALGPMVDSPYHGDYLNANKTYVFPGEARVADDSGNVYNANDLTYSNSLGGKFTDLTFYFELPIVLRNGAVIAYSNVFKETGRYQPPVAPDKIAVRGDNVFAFAAQAGGIAVEKIPISLLQPGQPGQPVNPNGLAYAPNAAALGQDEVLYVLSRNFLSVFRWSVAQRRYLDTIPLFAAARYMAYSAVTNRLYLAYPGGTITQIRLDNSLTEQPFVKRSLSFSGLATAGAYVFNVEPSLSRNTHNVFSPEGDLLSTKDMREYSEEYIWSSAHSRMYYFRDYTSPNDLIWEVIDANGKLGDQYDSPYHGEIDTRHPIRVAPDGSMVLLGSGSAHEPISLIKIGLLSNTLTDAAWSSGKLFTLRKIVNQTQLQKWDNLTTLANVRQFSGDPLRLFAIREGLLDVTSFDGIPRFSIWSSNLDELTHVPIADFSVYPSTGRAPLEVAFTNLSHGGKYDTSQWDFGDGETSTLQDPTHIYQHPGVYAVSLTVSGPGGSDTLKKNAAVTVVQSVYLPALMRVRP